MNFLAGEFLKMGVYFYACGDCGKTFPGCGEYYMCHSCDEFLCSSCGSEAIKVFGKEESDWYGIGPVKCQVCSGETVSGETVAAFLCYKFGINYNDVVKEIIEKRVENIPEYEK